jgi:NAD(P)-dependent dehydrogenase (short-subunit alcohol dehydrogenase family)
MFSGVLGRLDVLFANAGVGLAAPLEAVTEDQIDRQFDLNFKGAFFTTWLRGDGCSESS